MLFSADVVFGRRHETLQQAIRFAVELTPTRIAELKAHVDNAEAIDHDNAAVVRAVCLFLYALQRFGLADLPEHLPLVSRLARLVRPQASEMPEVMAGRWILGRVRLAQAAGRGLALAIQRDYTLRAFNCFCHVRETELAHPVLLPGVLVEYPGRLFISRDPLDVDPPVRSIHPPYRYRMATAAALIRLDPARAQRHGSDVDRVAAVLARVHPEAPLAHLNGALSVASAVALVPARPLTSYDRETGHRLAERIHLSIRVDGLPRRKWREWLATSHAVNAILATSDAEAFDEAALMTRQLRMLFGEFYVDRLPDFTRVDAVYRGAFDRVRREEPADYGVFLRSLMRGV